MQQTRREILDCIKLNGSMSIDQLGEELGVMPVTVRAHVNILERDHLLKGSEHRTGRAGRPSRVYSLTEDAQDLFPNSYDNLATSILDNVKELQGKEAAFKVVQKTGEDMAAVHAKRLQSKDMDSRVEEATRILNENGCLATWKKKGGKYVVTAHNCPYLHVAEHNPEICHMEVAFLEKALKTEVNLVDSVVGGNTNCVFVIDPR
ncbi:MAG: helix-turn-helix transcriptional regulator [Dehalococcoidia bacterium]